MKTIKIKPTKEYEFKIGEKFKYEDSENDMSITLEVIEDNFDPNWDKYCCQQCYFWDGGNGCKVHDSVMILCSAESRDDEKNVSFRRIE